jgi:hypothetical protein
VAAIKSSRAMVDIPPIYSLFSSDTSETLFGQLQPLNSSASEMEALPAAKGESDIIDAR